MDVVTNLFVLVILVILFVCEIINIALPGVETSLFLLSDEILERLKSIKKLLLFFLVENRYFLQLVVEKWYEDGINRGNVGLQDERSMLVGLQIDKRLTKAVMLLFEPVNMTFEDVVTGVMCRVSENGEQRSARRRTLYTRPTSLRQH